MFLYERNIKSYKDLSIYYYKISLFCQFVLKFLSILKPIFFFTFSFVSINAWWLRIERKTCNVTIKLFMMNNKFNWCQSIILFLFMIFLFHTPIVLLSIIVYTSKDNVGKLIYVNFLVLLDYIFFLFSFNLKVKLWLIINFSWKPK